LALLLGIWAGIKMHSTRPAGLSSPIAVPAGEASGPNPSDLPALTDMPAAPPKIPDRLPQFSLADPAGKPTPIASFAGKSLIINFWATWCAPCRNEIPLLESLHAEWAARGVSVVGVAVDFPDKVRDFAGRFKIPYPLLVGEQDALDAAAALGFASPVFPFTVFTDHRGEVVALFVGELHRPQAELILAQVQNLDRGRLALPAARAAIEAGLQALKAG
jgi:thiol-disulfide isomerase/thioredoxin